MGERFDLQTEDKLGDREAATAAYMLLIRTIKFFGQGM